MAQLHGCAMPIGKFFGSAYRLDARAQGVVRVHVWGQTVTSVDPTDARKETVRRFGRSDRSALRQTDGSRLRSAARLLSRPKCRPAKPVRSGGREPLGLVPGSPHCCLATSVRGPLRHPKDSSHRVQRPGVEPFHPQRRRRSRPTAKRLRPPPLHPQGRRGWS